MAQPSIQADPGEAPERVETLGGEVCALGLPSRAHRELSRRMHEQLVAQVSGSDCRVYLASLGVHVESMDELHHTIPDVAVVCGPERTHPEDEDLVLNPTVLVEVLSASTFKRDHVDKRFAYTAIATLRAYVVVDQYQQVVTVWSRANDGSWEAQIWSQGSLPLAGTDLRLDIDALYRE